MALCSIWTGSNKNRNNIWVDSIQITGNRYGTKSIFIQFQFTPSPQIYIKSIHTTSLSCHNQIGTISKDLLIVRFLKTMKRNGIGERNQGWSYFTKYIAKARDQKPLEDYVPVTMHKSGNFVHAPIKRTTFLWWTSLYSEIIHKYRCCEIISTLKMTVWIT